jgi:GNAT superfamily N-acetyltransferase
MQSDDVALGLPKPGVVVTWFVTVFRTSVVYGPADAAIIDLFVWPTYRRRGYVTLLESKISDRAALRGAGELNIVVLDADVIKGRAAAVGFLNSRGYNLTEYDNRQLQILGTRAMNSSH